MKALFDRKVIIPTVVALALLLICLLLGAASYAVTHTSALDSQYSKDNWEAEGGLRYALISLFIDPDANYNYSSIRQLQSSLETKLMEESVQSLSENVGARLYLDAYSSQTSLVVSSDRTEVKKSDAYLVGGDFFYIHKFPLVKGSYFNDDEAGMYSAVIDTVMAWQLYGSSDVVGMLLYIDNIPYTVSGVVEPQSGIKYDELYGSSPKIYINYLSRTSNSEKEQIPIECVELIVPDPVSGYALEKVKAAAGVDENLSAFVDNSSRFKLLSLYSQLGNFASRAVKNNRITYPEWENIALVASDIAVMLLFCQTVMAAGAVILLTIVSVLLYIRITRKARENKTEIINAMDNKFDEIRRRISLHRKSREHKSSKID